MFREIIKINDRGADIKLGEIPKDLNLMGLHVVLESSGSKVISEIDMLESFSIVSDMYKFTRPNLVNDRVIKMIDSRHPVVEQVMKDQYVPNDILMDKTILIFYSKIYKLYFILSFIF